jgi:hypothetical protein
MASVKAKPLLKIIKSEEIPKSQIKKVEESKPSLIKEQNQDKQKKILAA